jgi:hypothetical protein
MRRNKTQAAAGADLLSAYAKTHYCVAPPDDITLLIGVSSPKLSHLLQARSAASAAFLTAHNPYSAPTGFEENHRAQQRLLALLDRLGIAHLHGAGQDPEGKWASEESVLALGVTFDAASALARHFRQHAFVWIAQDATPRLAVFDPDSMRFVVTTLKNGAADAYP